MARRRNSLDETSASEAVDEAPVEPVEAPAVEKAPNPPRDIALTPGQYVQVRGHRFRQAAGFVYEMRRKFPGNKTRAEWDKLWLEFHNRVVG